jgi:glycosyltransferase involved in cell wall biosynthesis
MSCGLPIVVTSVGGLVEAVAGYDGAILVPPGEPIALQHALLQVAKLCGKRYADPHSWECTAARYQALFDALGSSANPVRQESKGLSLVR